jgi:hypothetical protein
VSRGRNRKEFCKSFHDCKNDCLNNIHVVLLVYKAARYLIIK